MKHAALRIAVLASLLALGACETTASPAPAPVAQALDATLRGAAERSAAPGLVAAIYRNGEIVETFAWGGADCAGLGVADAAAGYEIGSISKHITSVAIMQLAEQGRVALDAPVGQYLTDIPEAWRAVTLRQLLTHTSGVPDYEGAGGYGVYETSPTPAEVYAIVAAQPLDFEPGTQWSYSNTGYFLLSQVVQRVSGDRFGDYLRTHLFERAGADDVFMSGYGPDDVRLAQGCKPGEGEGAPRIPVRPISEASTFGAGGIVATLADWGRWDHALHNGRIISDASMREIFTASTLPDGSSTGYGFGMEVDDFRGARRYGHSGQTQGFTADYARFPDRGVSILVLANAYGGNPTSFMHRLMLRAMPDLSYDELSASADPDPARTNMVRRALRQVLLAEEPLDLLHPDMQRFARDPNAESQRAELRGIVAGDDPLIYLRSETLPNSNVQRHLYRIVVGGETHYFAVIVRDGVLFRLRYEER